MKGLLWTKEVMVFYCHSVLKSCLPPTNPNIICESKKLSLKNSSYVLEDNIFSLKHLK